jgi:hypothetical protein
LFIWSISHFIDDWVKIAQATKKKVEQEHSSLCFEDHQCIELEKVSM